MNGAVFTKIKIPLMPATLAMNKKLLKFLLCKITKNGKKRTPTITPDKTGTKFSALS